MGNTSKTTVGDVWDTFSPPQKRAVYQIIGLMTESGFTDTQKLVAMLILTEAIKPKRSGHGEEPRT